jgi:hypothetical protein
MLDGGGALSPRRAATISEMFDDPDADIHAVVESFRR